MAKKNFYRELARYSDLIFILPAAIGIGFGLGYLLDFWWDTYPSASLVLTFLGMGTGFYQVFRIVTRKSM